MLNAPPFAKKQMPGGSQPAADMQPAAGQVQAGSDPDEVEQQPASPEEQATYDALMRYTQSKIMADEKAYPKLEKIIQRDPINAIADATVAIIERLEKDKGEQDVDMLQGIAEEVVENLGDLAAEKGVQVSKADLNKAAALAIAKWSKAHPERVDQEKMTAVGNATLNAVQGQAGAQNPQPPPGAPAGGAPGAASALQGDANGQLG